MDKDLLDSAKNGVSRAGKSELIKYLTGKRLTRNQAIKAKCYDCNGMGEQATCDIETCALYPYSPYKSKTLGHTPTHTVEAKTAV